MSKPQEYVQWVLTDLFLAAMVFLPANRVAAELVGQLPYPWKAVHVSQVKVQSVSARCRQISLLEVAGSRCCTQRISMMLLVMSRSCGTYVSVRGLKAGAVALSVVAEASCDCGVLDFTGATSLAPLTGVGVDFGGSGIFCILSACDLSSIELRRTLRNLFSDWKFLSDLNNARLEPAVVLISPLSSLLAIGSMVCLSSSAIVSTLGKLPEHAVRMTRELRIC